MKKETRGFTLIELIVYAGLTSVLITIMSQVFLATLGVRIESQNTTSIEQDGRYMISRMTYDIRRAKSIVLPLAGQTQSGMTLTIPENGSDTEYTYAVQGSNFILTEGTVSARLNSDGSRLRDISVTRVENTLRVTFTLDGAGDIAVGSQSLTLQSTVGIR